MEYPSCVVWYLDIESKTIQQQPTLTLFMEFWDFWWVWSVHGETQYGLANCDECENWVQTSTRCNAGIPFTLWLVISVDVAVFKCAWRSREWEWDGKARRRGTVFRSEEFDASHPDWRPGRATACGTPDDRIHKALDNKEMVRIEAGEWEITSSDTAGECKTLVEIYTSQGASGAWRVHRWWLARFSLVLGDTEDLEDISEHCLNEWPLDTWVDSPIFKWLRDWFLPMLVNAQAEYPEHDEDEASNEALLHEPERYKSALPHAPPSQKAVLFGPLPGQVCPSKWWLTKWFADHLDIFYMYAGIGNDERTEMQLKFHDLPNHSVFVTTRRVGGMGLNPRAANYAVITQKFWVLNKQCQDFARVVQLEQNGVPHSWLFKTGPGGYDNRASDLPQRSGVAQLTVLNGLMSRPNITTSMIYCMLECQEDHTKQRT